MGMKYAAGVNDLWKSLRRHPGVLNHLNASLDYECEPYFTCQKGVKNVSQWCGAAS